MNHSGWIQNENTLVTSSKKLDQKSIFILNCSRWIVLDESFRVDTLIHSTVTVSLKHEENAWCLPVRRSPQSLFCNKRHTRHHLLHEVKNHKGHSVRFETQPRLKWIECWKKLVSDWLVCLTSRNLEPSHQHLWRRITMLECNHDNEDQQTVFRAWPAALLNKKHRKSAYKLQLKATERMEKRNHSNCLKIAVYSENSASSYLLRLSRKLKLLQMSALKKQNEKQNIHWRFCRTPTR